VILIGELSKLSNYELYDVWSNQKFVSISWTYS